MSALPTLEYLRERIAVDADVGVVRWVDATKYHVPLNGREAGAACRTTSGKVYWRVKVDGRPIKRSHIVFLFVTGKWPTQQIDHINGNSLDDRAVNLREATPTQNAWNHKSRKKSTALPMGIRQLPSGRFQARIACNKKTVHLGSFASVADALTAYTNKRKELFGDYA